MAALLDGAHCVEPVGRLIVSEPSGRLDSAEIRTRRTILGATPWQAYGVLGFEYS